MGKLTELEIRNLIKAGERFDGYSDGDGLYLGYRIDHGRGCHALDQAHVGLCR